MLDAEALKETLKTLSEVLPTVPSRLETLLAEEESLRRAAEEAARELKERRAEAEQTITRVEAALVELRDASAAREALVEQGLAVLTPALTAALEAVPMVGPVLAPVAALELTHLKQAPSLLRAAQEQAERALAAVQDGITASAATLSSALEQLARAEDSFRARVASAQATLTEHVSGLVQAAEARQIQTGQRLEAMSGTLASFEVDFQERLNAVNERIVQARTGQMLEETRDRAADLQQRIESALSQVADTLKDLGRGFRQTQDEAAQERSNLAPFFAELQRRLEPLKRAIESVKQAAEEVGVPL